LGDGTQTYRYTPVQTLSLTDVVAIGTGSEHSLAVKSDGTVWTWGKYGGSTPVQVAGIADVVGVAGGHLHSLAVKTDGTVWAWGMNREGQLGDGSTTDHSTPMVVPGLTNVIQVAAGMVNSAALKSDGTVWRWGRNYGDPRTLTMPTQIVGFKDVTYIATSDGYGPMGTPRIMAVQSDGTAWGWGTRPLGDGAASGSTTPVQVAGLTGVTTLATSKYFSLFVSAGEHTLPQVAGTWPRDGGCETSVQYAIVGFTEPVVNVSTDDLVVSSGTVVAVAGNGKGPYLFQIAGAARGPITAMVCGDITDTAGNPLRPHEWTFASSSFTGLDGDCDVDADDLAVFESCASAPAVPHNGSSVCQSLDFDHDGDVDQGDFGVFQRCYSGESVPVDPNCSN
jgi:hypothetical protein